MPGFCDAGRLSMRDHADIMPVLGGVEAGLITKYDRLLDVPLVSAGRRAPSVAPHPYFRSLQRLRSTFPTDRMVALTTRIMLAVSLAWPVGRAVAEGG